MMGLSQRLHLWRRKREQMKRRRVLNRQVDRNLLQGVAASKRSEPMFTREQAAALGVTGAELAVTLKTNAAAASKVLMFHNQTEDYEAAGGPRPHDRLVPTGRCSCGGPWPCKDRR